MSGSKGLKRYNGVEQDDEGAYVYYDEHIAALRAAKAEGIRMVETYARAFVHERAVQLDGFTGSSGMAGVIRGKQSEADRIVDWADARAAQIEEGERNTARHRVDELEAREIDVEILQGDLTTLRQLVEAKEAGTTEERS